MARIRTVKPDLFAHEELFDAERETGLPLRLAFIGMFTCCDREGRFKWRPRTLKKDVMPHDDIDFSRVLDALATRGFILKYACGTEEYGVIPTWHKHQVINNRESTSDIPEPTESTYISMTSTREARVDDACVTESQVRKEEGKGKEGKGREEEGKGKPPLSKQSPDESMPSVIERRGVPEAATTTAIAKISKPRGDAGEAARTVFTYWQRVFNHPRAQLDAKREKAIKARLKDGYTVEDLCIAVDGCSRSAYHMGQNDTRTLYNDIELICRDGPKVDGFIKKATVTPNGPQRSNAQQQTIDNLAAYLQGEQP